MNEKEFKSVKSENYKERVVLGSLICDLEKICCKEIWKMERNFSVNHIVCARLIKDLSTELTKLSNE